MNWEDRDLRDLFEVIGLGVLALAVLVAALAGIAGGMLYVIRH